MDQKEITAVTATLPMAEKLRRVAEVVGEDIGDPVNDPHDSVKLRERFNLTVEHNHRTAWSFNDQVQACHKHTWSNDAREAGRIATVIAVAAMWREEIHSKPNEN